jgi:hypothetical protein
VLIFQFPARRGIKPKRTPNERSLGLVNSAMTKATEVVKDNSNEGTMMETNSTAEDSRQSMVVSDNSLAALDKKSTAVDNSNSVEGDRKNMVAVNSKEGASMVKVDSRVTKICVGVEWKGRVTEMVLRAEGTSIYRVELTCYRLILVLRHFRGGYEGEGRGEGRHHGHHGEGEFRGGEYERQGEFRREGGGGGNQYEGGGNQYGRGDNY